MPIAKSINNDLKSKLGIEYTAAAPVKEETLQDRVCRGVREMIENSELVAGDRIVERRLAEQFNVSRVPVRESLLKLEAEGLIVANPSGGYVIKQFSLSDIIELFELRMAIESYAAKKAAMRCNQFDIEYLMSIHKRFEQMVHLSNDLDGSKLSQVSQYRNELDMEFHEAILRLSGNEKYLKVSESFNSSIISKYLSETLKAHLKEFYDEAEDDGDCHNTILVHKGIIDAISARDGQLAFERMQSHIEAVLSLLHEIERLAGQEFQMSGTR